MSVNEKAIKAGVGYTVGNYLIKGVSFFSIPLFARLLSKDDYGIYNTFLAYESVLYVLFGISINNSYKKAKYVFVEDFDKYVSSSIVFVLLNSFFVCIILMTVKLFVGDNISLNETEIILLCIISCSSAIIACYNAYIGLEYDYSRFVIVSCINAVCNISFSLILIQVFPSNKAFARILGTVIPSAMISIYICRLLLINTKKNQIKKMIKWGVKYSLPLVPHGLSQVILSQFDRLMIKRYCGFSAVGEYSFAFNIYSIISITSASLSQAWEPWFFEKMHQKKYDEIRKVSSMYIACIGVFSVIMMLLAPEMVLVLGSSKYENSIKCVLPILCGGFFSFLYTIPVLIEYYYGKTKYIAFGSFVAAIVNIILNYYGIRQYGYYSAAYTTAISYFLYFIFHWIISSCIHGGNVFSSVSILGTSSIVVSFMILSLKLTNLFFLRLSIAAMLVVFTLFFLRKKIGAHIEWKKKN